jgi:hypothetical protein
LRTRVVGAVVGAVPGLLLLVASLVANDYSLRANLSLALPTLAVGAVLGWLFAPRAIASVTIRSALLTAGGITLIAVPIGAFMVAATMTVTALSTGNGYALTPQEIIGGTVAIGLVGLVFLGIPLAGITFAIASFWVLLLCFAARMERYAVR